jgi:hypothetical protein
MSSGSERSQTIETRPAYSHLDHVTAPLPGFHPTRAEGTSTGYLTKPASPSDPERDVQWTSRASRKRIYAQRPVTVQHDHNIDKAHIPNEREKGATMRENGEGREAWSADLRVHPKAQKIGGFTWMIDVSFWVAFIFTFGSVCWVSGIYCDVVWCSTADVLSGIPQRLSTGSFCSCPSSAMSPNVQYKQQLGHSSEGRHSTWGVT